MRGGRVGGSSGMCVRVDKRVLVAVGCKGGVDHQQPQIATHSLSNPISTTGCSLNKWQFDKTTHPPVNFCHPPTRHSPRIHHINKLGN